jgi:glycosyltransferase involved in cell wall biosynthesis
MKMVRFAVDSVISFSFAPLRLAIWGWFIALAASFVGIVYALAIRLYITDWVKRWASIFTAVLFLGGIQLIMLGILGEYVGRIYAEVKLRPLFVVRERLGFNDEPKIEGNFSFKAAKVSLLVRANAGSCKLQVRIRALRSS